MNRVTGVGSPRSAGDYLALARRVTIGNLEFEDCVTHVGEASPFPNADGVIGTNLFDKFLVQVDPASTSVNLSPYGDGSASTEMVRAYRVGHLLVVRAPADGDPDSYFLVDTGASFSSTPGPVQDAAGAAEIDVRSVGGRVAGARRAQPLRLTIAGRALVDENPVKLDLTELSRYAGIEISGIIGYPLLAKSGLTINYRDGLVQFGEADH